MANYWLMIPNKSQPTNDGSDGYILKKDMLLAYLKKYLKTDRIVEAWMAVSFSQQTSEERRGEI